MDKFVQLSKEEKTLSDLTANLEQPKEVMDVCLPLTVAEDFHLDATRIICEYAAYAERTAYTTLAEDNLEGSRANYDEKHGNGWATLRACEQCQGLPLHIESDSEHGALKMAKDVYYFLKTIPSVDAAPLKDAIAQERQRLLGNIKTDFYSDAAYLTFIFGEKVVIQQEADTQTEEETPAENTEAIAEPAPSEDVENAETEAVEEVETAEEPAETEVVETAEIAETVEETTETGEDKPVEA